MAGPKSMHTNKSSIGIIDKVHPGLHFTFKHFYERNVVVHLV